MSGEQRSFRIEARVRYATWPGERAICAVLSEPTYVADLWYLGNAETGEVSELAPYRYRAHRTLGVRPS